MNGKNTSIAFAILAAALYAINIPLSKMLLDSMEPVMTAAFLYLGAGLGMTLLLTFDRHPQKGDRLTRSELPFTVAMVLLDVAAPVLLMLGLRHTSSAGASLLNNFEIVATSLIALLLFGEKISSRLTVSIVLVTAASIMLSFEGGSLGLNPGSLLILAATCCWGLENNCTRKLSAKSSAEITAIKGVFSGLGSLMIALIAGERLPQLGFAACAMLLGFVSYGLSINFYIKAQKELGAAKTSAYYSLAPFLGVAFAMLILGEKPGLGFYPGLALMAAATVLMVFDTISCQHTHVHVHTHCHPHRHGQLVHEHEHDHVHEHIHIHGGDSSLHGYEHDALEGHTHSHVSLTDIIRIRF